MSSLDDLLSSYDFELPEAQIAQTPAAKREASRLMRLNKRTGAVSHHQFLELPGLLRAGDLLILNDTRVIPARLRGQRASGGRIEVLLLRPLGPCPPRDATQAEAWEALLKPSARLKVEEPVQVGGGLTVYPLARRGEAWEVRLEASRPISQVLEEVGEIPLPPYIKREAGHRQDALDRERYQTVYARAPGSAAAPTAGLHFTPQIFESLAGAGVEVGFVTLHVGPGTFAPVRVDDIRSHTMHAERYHVPRPLWEKLREARKQGRRVVAAGTTSVRTLESLAAWEGQGELVEGREDADGLSGDTRIFIHPGYRFKRVDALITNFHLPRSSLLMLVSALAGRERILSAYATAVAEGYRFFSYGDAMLIDEEE